MISGGLELLDEPILFVEVVDGVLEFDPRIVEGGADCAYVVGLGVADSAETRILDERWRGVMACETEEVSRLGERGVRVVETFRFAVMPGRYSLEVSVEPDGKPEMARRLEYDLTSLPVDALASDLILAREVGWFDSTEAGRWTVRRGQLGIGADPYVVATPSRPNLAYYLELYPQPGAPLQGRVQGVIRRADGDEVVRLGLEELERTEDDRPIAGKVSLAGLGPGDYALEVRLELADTVVTRSRAFGMATDLLALESQGSADGGPASETIETYFFGLRDEELAELFDPVVVWLGTARERERYWALTPDGKRRLLATYFEEVAPKLIGGGEPPLDLFLERAQHVNKAFRERAGREEQEGWRTDRGRVYLLRGPPDDRLERPFPGDNSAPYEIWSYNVGTGYVYLFVDETRFRHYRLLFSTDPSETALPDWNRRAGRSAVNDLVQHFGVHAQF